MSGVESRGFPAKPTLRLPPYPARESFASPRLAFRTLKRTLQSVWLGAEAEPRSVARATRRAFHLVARELYKPGEIRALGLLRADVPEAALRRVASRSTMLRVATTLNPEPWRGNLENKATFYRLASGAGLPVPSVVGLFLPNRLGEWRGASVAGSRDEWVDRLLHDAPDEFVIKPVSGGWGRGVSVLSREGAERFRTASGRSLSASELLEEMAAAASDGCLLQERIRSHPALEAFSGSPYLQTLRLYTLIDASGAAQLLRGSLRVIAGSNWVDNYGAGADGNFVAQIDGERGVLASASGPDRASGGIVPIERHPTTGVPVAGFALPDWRAARELALALARCFSPLRWAGWDIALTPNGPVAIEGNWNADAPNNSQRVDWLFSEIRRLY